MAKKASGLSLDPQHPPDQWVWYYEMRKGFQVYVDCLVAHQSQHQQSAITFLIPWRMIEASLRRRKVSQPRHRRAIAGKRA